VLAANEPVLFATGPVLEKLVSIDFLHAYQARV
jgi:hypothetical protein